ncbi:hypothetical protein [Marinicella litoralis]|uniref:hypothetical protein n=1 Tax=Marinicella litoralis TaxID=644220 RepID=UPI001C557800|nr:hypothetical protein [Marinicella litoralis]
MGSNETSFFNEKRKNQPIENINNTENPNMNLFANNKLINVVAVILVIIGPRVW